MSIQAGQIHNLFSEDDLIRILQILNYLKDAPNTGVFQAYTNGFTETDIISKIINQLVVKQIEKKLDRKINVKCGMHLKEVIPWEIHTDYNHKFDQGSTPDLAILIPLLVFDNNKNRIFDTHTVIFNELCQTNWDDYKKSQSKLKSNASNIFEQHCSHCKPDDLEYVSLHGVYKWDPGSVIYWDRKMLHCSDNFIKNNIKEKQALVLFSTR